VTAAFRFQASAQLEARWDAAGARAIWDTAGIKVILGGVTDPDTLDRLSRLYGEIRLRTQSRTHDQYRGRGHTVSYEPVPVLPPDLLRTLPEWRALIVRGNLSPVVVRLRMAWKRHDYRHTRQRNRAPHRPRPAAVESPDEPAQVTGYRLILPPAQNGSPWRSQSGPQPNGVDDELARRHSPRRPGAAPHWALPPGTRRPVSPPRGGGRRPPRPRRPWDPPVGPGGQT
jgi:type IV secretory pathway TraG/TraD family ATPase VirD4